MNDELRDFELKSDDLESSDSGGPSGSPRWVYVVGAIVVVALIVAAYLWFGRREAEPPAEPAVETAPSTAPLPAEQAEPTLAIGEVPPLAESDAWLRGLAQQISSHPRLAEWLVTEELVRTFVVVVDNLAEGVSPRKHLAVAKPEEAFAVKESEARVFVDPVSYRRYDVLVDVVESLDTAGSAELYQALLPLCRQSYQDLGYPPEAFEDALRGAVRRILAAPVVDQPVELERKVTAYRFKDPALEELSPATKQLLRLGPHNLRRLQMKVRELAQAAGVEP